MAQTFDDQVHNAAQHPVIVIIASVKARIIQGTVKTNAFLFFNIFIKHCQVNVLGEAKLTNYPATRSFINLNHEAVDDLRDAFRLVIYLI